MTTVVKMIFGSHLYGLNTKDSDQDFKTVILPTKQEILLQTADFIRSKSTGEKHAKNTVNDIDDTDISYMAFTKLATKGDTSAMDMLHAPSTAIIESSDWWDELVANRSKFYTKSMKSYVGYVRTQAGKYGVKGSKLAVMEETLKIAKASDNGMGRTVSDIMNSFPTNEFARIVSQDHPAVGPQKFYEIAGRKFQETLKLGVFVSQLQTIYDKYGHRAQMAKNNDGIDWKAISHALRAGYQAKYIYLNSGFSYPLPETDFLMKVKLGELDYVSQVQPILESLVDEVISLSEVSTYPDQVDPAFLESLVMTCHREVLSN